MKYYYTNKQTRWNYIFNLIILNLYGFVAPKFLANAHLDHDDVGGHFVVEGAGLEDRVNEALLRRLLGRLRVL
jgi:hypothetical protein